MNVHYYVEREIVEFKFLFYDSTPGDLTDGFLERCIFEYSEDGNIYYTIMGVSTSKQMFIDDFEISFWGKKRKQNIRIFDDFYDNGSKYWTENYNKVIDAWVVPKREQHIVNGKEVKTLRSYITVHWELPVTSKPIKIIRIRGNWKVLGTIANDKIVHYHYLNKMKKRSNVEKNTSLKLNTAICNDVKVTGGTDAIIVTGAETGVNNKIYNASGVVVQSVVAKDDVVNFKLPKKQIYTVKVGAASYRVAL